MKTMILITTVLVFALSGSLFAVTPDASGRLLGGFSFQVDDYYLDGSNAYFVAESGSESFFPITIKNKGQSHDYVFHATFGDQLNPPPQPDGINIRFEPDHLSLEPDEERTIDVVIEVEQQVKPTVYNVGIVGSWDEPNGFKGSSFRLHIDDYHGNRALPTNFVFPSPLLIYKESGGQTDVVECQGGKVLVIKESNGHPACINFDSIAKLIDREWIKSDMQFLKISDLNPVYYPDEQISFIVHKVGLANCDWITVKIFDKDNAGSEKPLFLDTAERICLKEARGENSPEKSWELHAEFPQKETEPITFASGTYVVQVSSDGAVAVEREFKIIERVMENEE